MNQITLRAAAKLNLSLDIVGRREDGYHLLEMVMQSVSLYDRIAIRKAEGISLDAPGLADSRNLAWKAAEAFFAAMELPGGAAIALEKRIPAQAGMAGGSADAAAVLIGLDRLYGTNLPLVRLQEIGLSLGADVPYCLVGGTALVEGIGEKVASLPTLEGCFFAAVKPPFGISTGAAFSAFDQGKAIRRPNTPGLLAAMEKRDFPTMALCMENALEGAAGRQGELDSLRSALLAQGALAARMTGSGSVCFGLFTEKGAAKSAAEALKAGGLETWELEPAAKGVEILSLE